MGPRFDTFDALDALGRKRMRGTKMQHGIGSRMGRAAARMTLEGDARVGEIERLRPFGQDAIRIKVALTVEHRKEALLVLERGVIGGHALLCEQRGKQPVARRMTDMERLGHGAEIGLDARGHRGRERERGRDLVGRQPKQMRACRRCPEGAERRGRMPALLIMMEVDRARELAFGLDAGRIGGDEGLAGYARGERPQRRQDRRRRMTAKRVAAIVEVERVRRRTIDQRG